MNALERQIAAEINQKGPIPFARFMHLALYSPGLGYYERMRPVGRQGDFFTNVSVGPLFGELLAWQFAHWLEGGASPSKPLFIEAGAHEGRLAGDILRWLRRHRPALFGALTYIIVEPSRPLRQWQQQTLRQQFPCLTWLPSIDALEPRSVEGIIFSNELLDAMPVHRLAWSSQTRRWFEWHVGLGKTGFAWQPGPLTPQAGGCLPVLPPALLAVLPDQYTLEVSPLAIVWWTLAAGRLRSGKLLTIDFGLTEQEWLRPERCEGTLRTYAQHRAGASPLEQVGEQDITAHVNFSALQTAGQQAGLDKGDLMRQSQFLAEIARQSQNSPASAQWWAGSGARQWVTLTHPEHLGERFRVLIQSRAATGA